MTRRFQTALARAYTDSTARQELYRGETGRFAAFELSPTELTALVEFAQENRARVHVHRRVDVEVALGYVDHGLRGRLGAVRAARAASGAGSRSASSKN